MKIVLLTNSQSGDKESRYKLLLPIELFIKFHYPQLEVVKEVLADSILDNYLSVSLADVYLLDCGGDFDNTKDFSDFVKLQKLIARKAFPANYYVSLMKSHDWQKWRNIGCKILSGGRLLMELDNELKRLLNN